MSVSTHLKLIAPSLVKTSNDCSRSVLLVELKQKLYFFSGDSQFAYVAQHSTDRAGKYIHHNSWLISLFAILMCTLLFEPVHATQQQHSMVRCSLIFIIYSLSVCFYRTLGKKSNSGHGAMNLKSTELSWNDGRGLPILAITPSSSESRLVC